MVHASRQENRILHRIYTNEPADFLSVSTAVSMQWICGRLLSRDRWPWKSPRCLVVDGSLAILSSKLLSRLSSSAVGAAVVSCNSDLPSPKGISLSSDPFRPRATRGALGGASDFTLDRSEIVFWPLLLLLPVTLSWRMPNILR